MRILRDLETQQYFWPVKNSAAAIVDGALLMPGVTAETDLGVLIPATSACGDAIGYLVGAVAAADTNTLVNGTAWLVKPVAPITPMRVIRIDYDTTDTMAIASMNSTTSVRVTSIENNIDSSYLYCTGGTGVGELRYVTVDDGTDLTIKAAATYAATDTLIKILRLFHQLGKINSTYDKLGTDAAAGSWTILVLQNYIQYGGLVEILNPTVHGSLDDLNNYSDLKFYADICIRNAGPYTVD